MTFNDAMFRDARRSFLARLGGGMAVAGAGLATGQTVAAAGATTAFEPARHAEDDWLDQIKGKHRLVFDTTNAGGFGAALLYANNFFIASQSGYGLQDSDSAIVIVARHNSTAYACTDAIWAKYGHQITLMTKLNDPKTNQAPAVNLLNTAAPGLPNLGVTIDTVVKRGVHFAVCQMATRVVAGQIAKAVGGNADAIYGELTSNLVGNSHLVPAGIVAVNRAQERGYASVTTTG